MNITYAAFLPLALALSACGGADGELSAFEQSYAELTDTVNQVATATFLDADPASPRASMAGIATVYTANMPDTSAAGILTVTADFNADTLSGQITHMGEYNDSDLTNGDVSAPLDTVIAGTLDFDGVIESDYSVTGDVTGTVSVAENATAAALDVDVDLAINNAYLIDTNVGLAAIGDLDGTMTDDENGTYWASGAFVAIE